MSACGLRVRDATAGDHATLHAWMLAMAAESEGLALAPARLAAGLQAGLADVARARYFIAERDGAPIGTLMLTREWSDWRNGWWWWIQSVYVAESARRSGVFRALYADVARRARAAGAVGLRLYVETENARAQATYEGLGMERCHYFMYEQALTAAG